MEGGAAEMPRYKCHKTVWALKIGTIEFDENGTAKITPADDRYATFEALDYRAKFHGDEKDIGNTDFGYYVVYDDSYTSWSPTKAFEDGYTLIR